MCVLNVSLAKFILDMTKLKRRNPDANTTIIIISVPRTMDVPFFEQMKAFIFSFLL